MSACEAFAAALPTRGLRPRPLERGDAQLTSLLKDARLVEVCTDDEGREA